VADICVTGIWHQGAVVSACLADLGNRVRGVCDEKTAARLNAGQPTVYEPILPEIVVRNVELGRLQYTSDYSEGLAGAEFVYICTDTPVDANDDSDLSSIYAIAENIGQHLHADIVLCVCQCSHVNVPVIFTHSVPLLRLLCSGSWYDGTGRDGVNLGQPGCSIGTSCRRRWRP
jgi:UDPglucose 6-dehydrogenase